MISSLSLFSQGGASCEDAVDIITAGTYTSDNSIGDQWFKCTNATIETLELT